MSSITYQPEPHLEANELSELFQHTDWTRTRSHGDVKIMLNLTSYCFTARSDGQLIGFTRVLSDDVFRGFVEDVIVHSDFRQQGIGKAMMLFVLEELGHLQEIALGCSPENKGFYDRLGFAQDDQAYMKWKRQEQC